MLLRDKEELDKKVLHLNQLFGSWRNEGISKRPNRSRRQGSFFFFRDGKRRSGTNGIKRRLA